MRTSGSWCVALPKTNGTMSGSAKPRHDAQRRSRLNRTVPGKRRLASAKSSVEVHHRGTVEDRLVTHRSERAIGLTPPGDLDEAAVKAWPVAMTGSADG